jgi:hypothetical protein
VKTGPGVSGDTSSAASITWLEHPAKLLPQLGPVVVGVAPPLRLAQQRTWQRIADECAAGTPKEAADRA